MFVRLATVLTLTLSLAGCNRESYSRSTSGFSATDKKLLYDFRSDTVPRKLPNATAIRTVLSSAFPSSFADPGQCRPSQPRALLATVLSAAEGSFTAAGLKQQAYLVAAGECGPPPGIATRRLVVFTAGALTANVEAPGQTILGAYDLDGDHKDELLLQETSTGPGQIIKVARLVAFDKDKLTTVEDLGQIYSNPCAAGMPARSISASAVYYLPPPAGQKPRFTVELYRAACPAAGQEKQWARAPAK